MLLANILYEEQSGVLIWRALPVLLGAMCVLAIAYRYYSAFLAAKVAALDDSYQTPSTKSEIRNPKPIPNPKHETFSTAGSGIWGLVLRIGFGFRAWDFGFIKKWVLFGRHFAAISGAGPLIGPVLALQYGYLPGLWWLVIGACLAGAVQDMLVLAASVRRGGRSLVEIVRTELGRPAAMVVSAAILLVVLIALGAFGFVFVNALGGDRFQLAEDTQIILPNKQSLEFVSAEMDGTTIYRFPEDCRVRYNSDQPPTTRSEEFLIETHRTLSYGRSGEGIVVGLPPGSVELIPGSSWGTFAITCTILISLLMGWHIREARNGGGIVRASVCGVIAVIAAVIVGNWIPGSILEQYFTLTKDEMLLALAGYGLIASVLPVWLLSSPRDYLSSFLKIGTLVLLVIGVLAANPRLPLNHQFLHGGPNFKGDVFPFVFICIMGGAISGLHLLVCSGATAKMIEKESHIRTIGYGAMLLEGLVGIVALIAAAALEPQVYYDINTRLPDLPKYQRDIDELSPSVSDQSANERDLGKVQTMIEGEALRGRTGGAVTLAVGTAQIFTDALQWTGLPADSIMKYGYHFVLVFEALFILTTIDAGTRIARSLLQEALGIRSQGSGVRNQGSGGRGQESGVRNQETEVRSQPGASSLTPDPCLLTPGGTPWLLTPDSGGSLPGALLASLVVTAGWAWLVKTASIGTIWPMFGIANQLLAVVGLALATTLLINSAKARYVPVTLLPMLFVTATAMTAGIQMIGIQFPALIQAGQVWTGVVNIALTLFVIICVALLLLLAGRRWLAVLTGKIPTNPEQGA